MKVKNRIRVSYVLWALLPLFVGALSALLSMKGMKENASLPQPALQPPPWVFMTAWTVLYLLMGIGAGLVWNAVPRGFKDALVPFFGQLILDCLNRTENAMTQEHAFKAAELSLQAQANAVRLK